MKCSATAALLFVALVARISAQPTGPVIGYQDSLGQYSFGYSGPTQARSEVRSLDGVTRGAYSYVDGAGSIQSAEYTADEKNGFRLAAANLPQAPAPVQDTPEVTAARAAHLLAVQEALNQAAETPQEENHDVQVLSKSAEDDGVQVISEGAEDDSVQIDSANPEPEESGKDVAENEPVKSAEPIVGDRRPLSADNEASIEPQQTVEEAKKSVETGNEAAAAKETKTEAEAEAEVQQPGKGKSIENLVLPPYFGPVAGSLPVPLIPVNFDLPIISAYSGQPGVGAKVDHQPALPQAIPTQGLFTPAGTTLKTLPAAAPQPEASAAAAAAAAASVQQPGVPFGEPVAAAAASGYPQYERARASVYAPVGPVYRFGYEPTTVTTFLRYSPFPYVAYNIV